ncbi:hypothetical protein JRI60_01835 [Archangium violaceum]|uniref:hypothetical protein n=1 Tax=Archangium violaceum TaxID=83451 RepID=UPI00194F47C8|nr:hypothetical protein [Archangium violaceum]QRN97851.1 hypothetical protein JRI60_01835 [Archangium violaceum]
MSKRGCLSHWLAALLSLVIWSTSSFAAEGGSQQQDDERHSNLAQQIQVSLIQENLKALEADLQVLQREAAKTQNVLNALKEVKIDEPRLRGVFQTLSDNTNALAQQADKGTRLDPTQVARVKQGLRELRHLTTDNVPAWPSPPTSSENARSVLLEIYVDDGIKYTSKIPWEQLFALSWLDADATERVVSDQVKALHRTLQSVTADTILEDNKGLRDAANTAWSAVRGRIESARSVRETRKEDLLQTLDELGTIQQQTDKWLIYSIMGMIVILFLIFLSAIVFAQQDIQRLIFGGRLLVELVGMAFLLLTIIILGTGAKIDRAVLGALLGTVGGYIFGQQIRRSTREEETSQRAAQPADVAQPLNEVAEFLKKAQANGVSTDEMTKLVKKASMVVEKAQSNLGTRT